MADEGLDIDALEKSLAIREKSLALEEKMLKAMELQGKRTKGMADQRKKVAALQKELNKGQSEFLKAEIQLEKLGKSRSAQMKTLTMLGGAFMKIVEKTQDLIKRGSELTKNTQQSMHMSVNDAKKLNQQISSQITGGKMYETTITESVAMMHALNDAYGGAVKMTAEQAVNMDITAKKLGISTTEAASFSHLMFMSGEASQETAMAILSGTKALSDASGVKFGEVMKDITANSKLMMNNFGKSGDEIAIMAVQARKMGFELSDMVTLSDSLLDVENRIEKQMSFNALTGKEVNLDKATALMLQGKEALALEETRKQLGDISGLNKMELKLMEQMTGFTADKIMNGEAIAEQAKVDAESKQEILNIEAQIREGQIAEFAAKTAERELAKDAHSQTLAFEENLADKAALKLQTETEQYNLALLLQKVQIAISGIMAAQAISSALKDATEKSSLRSAIAALPKLVAQAAVRAATAVSAMLTNAAATFGIGTAIALAATAGAAAWLYSQKGMSDGVIGSDGGMVVSGPKGSIQLDKDDSIIAGTNLGGKGGGKKSGSGDASALLSKMDELISAVRAGANISVDGYQMNEALHLEKIPAGMA